MMGLPKNDDFFVLAGWLLSSLGASHRRMICYGKLAG